MALFNSASEKANKLKERIQERREGLEAKQKALQEELKFLFSKKIDEFAEAVLNDDKGYSDAKITKEINNVREDIADVQRQLSELLVMETNQMQKVQAELNAEYDAANRKEQAKIRQLEDEIRLKKFEYLQMLVDYRGKVRESEAKLREVNNARQQAGIKTFIPDLAMGFTENQYDGDISPIVHVAELRESFMGRFPYHEATVAKYKK